MVDSHLCTSPRPHVKFPSASVERVVAGQLMQIRSRDQALLAKNSWSSGIPFGQKCKTPLLFGVVWCYMVLFLFIGMNSNPVFTRIIPRNFLHVEAGRMVDMFLRGRWTFETNCYMSCDLRWSCDCKIPT